jgi:hypothetical protein
MNDTKKTVTELTGYYKKCRLTSFIFDILK